MKNRNLSIRFHQTSNIIMITFWSQFASYALNTILILFLTRPFIKHGLGYDQATAYAFIGISQATSYLMPILGGYMADNVLGVRRSILFGGLFLAFSYLLVMLSGYTITTHGDTLFVIAYALLPVSNSLLMGTSSTMVSHIYAKDAVKAKSAMTYYYLSINVGALLAAIIAPQLFQSRYGPLSVLTLTFVGKAIAALNFAYRYRLYNTVIWGKDRRQLAVADVCRLLIYMVIIYTFTLFAYSYIYIANIVVSIGCVIGIIWFLGKTWRLKGNTRFKQLVAFVLMLESIVFFVIYNQMNSTLVLFAQNNSDSNLFGLTIDPAQYQTLNPILIIFLGLQLPKFYKKFPRFTIPYQFACGTLFAGCALLVMNYAAIHAVNGIVNGNYIGLTYILITIGELWVSAIGLSMIGLYCEQNGLSFAMGVWMLGSSLSNTISGQVAKWVAIPKTITSPMESLPIYQHYYFNMGFFACISGILMLGIASYLLYVMAKKGIENN